MLCVDADAWTVAGLLRDTALIGEVLRVAGHRLTGSPGRWLSAGDVMPVRLRVLPGVSFPVRLAVREVGIDAVAVEVRSGPLAGLTLAVTLSPRGTGTSVRDGVRDRPSSLPARLLLWFIGRRVPGLRAAAAELLVGWAADVAARRVVVATALVRDGAVLAAQRTRPPALAGRWELPGGRVEPGESEPDAVVRECREELGCAVNPAGRVGTDLLIDAGVMRVHAAIPVAGSEPEALEHAGLRWVGPDELDAIDWVDADRAVVADLRALLTSHPSVRDRSR